jgi:hypothetical protein
MLHLLFLLYVNWQAGPNQQIPPLKDYYEVVIEASPRFLSPLSQPHVFCTGPGDCDRRTRRPPPVPPPSSVCYDPPQNYDIIPKLV